MKVEPRRHGLRRVAATIAFSILLSAVVPGCATAPAGYGEEVYDPFEKVNRKIFSFNSGVDKILLRPIAKGYRFITPDLVEAGVHNFFVNLRTPLEAANSLLQGKPRDAGASTGRFLLNSTIGIGGLVDVAAMNGIERRQEGFAQTLATWGVPSGPYLVVPFIGPGSLRDIVGVQADTFGAPLYRTRWTYDNTSVRDKLVVLRIIDLRANLLGIDEQISAAFDPYAFVRSAYGQRMDYLIYDGDPPEEEFDDEEFED